MAPRNTDGLADVATIRQRTRDFSSGAPARYTPRIITAKPAVPLRERLQGPAKVEKKESQGFLGGLFDRFMDDIVNPTLGRAFFEYYDQAKQTYGIGALPTTAPIVFAARKLQGEDKKVDKAFDAYGNLYKAAYSLTKDNAWDPAKSVIEPAVLSTVDFIGDGADVAGETMRSTIDWLESEVPGARIASEWAKKNAIEPVGDFVTPLFDSIFNSRLEERLDSEDVTPEDRQMFFESNDIEMPLDSRIGMPAEWREKWINRALGESGVSMWDDKPSGFTREELSKMSDKELLNAALGSHTNILGRVYEGVKSDFSKISAMPAAVQQLDDVIYDRKGEGDYRGLGQIAQFIGKQIAYVPYAVLQANIYAATGGQLGDYKPLAKALEKEPLLTSLDAVSTASGAGKVAVAGLKTGGIGARIGTRIPGAAAAAGRIAATAERPVLGAPARAARGVRGLADIADRGSLFALTPEARRAAAAGVAAEDGVQAVEFRVRGGLGSALIAKAKRSLYQSDTRAGKRFRAAKNRYDASIVRALKSHIANVRANTLSAPAARALNKIFNEDPVVARAVVWALYGADEILDISEKTGSILGKSADEQANQLQRALDGDLWINSEGTARYGTSSPGEGFRRVLTDETAERLGISRADLTSQKDKYIYLTEEEAARTLVNVDILRGIAQTPEEKLNRAIEIAFGPLENVLGERSGARRLVGFRGAETPEGSLADLVSGIERTTVEERLPGLGLSPAGRVTELPENVRAQFGLSPLGETATGRRAFPGYARLQDLDVARILASEQGESIRRALLEALGSEQASVAARATNARRVSASQKGVIARLKKVRDELKAENAALRKDIAKKKKEIGSLKTEKAKQKRRDEIAELNNKIESNKAKISDTQRRIKEAEKGGGPRAEELRSLERQQKAVDEAVANIDDAVESIIRDILEEQGAGGSRVFLPSGIAPKGARTEFDPKAALAGRAGSGIADRLEKIHKGQYNLVSSAEDLRAFGDSLVRNMRIPVVAYEIVTSLNRYLLRRSVVLRPAETLDELRAQIAWIQDMRREVADGQAPSFHVIPIDDSTGFLTARRVAETNSPELTEVRRLGDTAADYESQRIADVVANASDDIVKNDILSEQNLGRLSELTEEGFNAQYKGKRLAIVDSEVVAQVRREAEAASRASDRFGLGRLSRKWVRFTLSTLPRTPMANILGSGVLAVLSGSGVRGFRTALRLMERGDTPPELMSIGLAGAANADFIVGAPVRTRRFLAGMQRYMNWIYSYNVIGEDLSRLAAFTAEVRRGLKKNPKLREQLLRELEEVTDISNDFEELVAYVARGDFADNAEALRLRDKALGKATDFLGGRAGLTATQREITKFIPFYSWLSHILKLYFYTMPVQYPGRALLLNGLARLGYQQQVESGAWDTFYKDAILWGREEGAGGNIQATGFRTNIAPFQFLDLGQGGGVTDFLFGSTTPVLTVPLAVAGAELPGVPPLRSPEGDYVGDRPIFDPGRAEATAARIEGLLSPLGLLQRNVSPGTSLTANIARTIAGRDIPIREQRQPGARYAREPRGINGRGLVGGLADIGLGAFGISPVRTFVGGPAARERIRREESRQKSRILED